MKPFWALLGGGALNSTGRWLEMLVIAVFVLEQTGSALMVASMMMLRMLPMGLFGLFAGLLARRIDRWLLLKLGCVVVTAMALWMAWLAARGSVTVAWTGAAAFASGLVWTFDFSARRTLMAEIVGQARVSRAMSLDILAGSSTRFIGPLLGGTLYALVGFDGAFLISAALYLLALAAFVLLGSAEAPRGSDGMTVTRDIAEGFREVLEHPRLPGILAVTLVFNILVFPFYSMVPVIGREIFALSEIGVGALVSMEGLGSLIGAAALALLARNDRALAWYLLSVIGYCAMAIVFAATPGVWLAAPVLLLIGLISAGFGAMQSAIVLLEAPDGSEQRAMGVLSVCIGTAPLGFLHIGLMAEWLGPLAACVLLATEGLLAMALILWHWPELRASLRLGGPPARL
ncbi:MAG: MFS transporter [Pseudomonadota bacterium]